MLNLNLIFLKKLCLFLFFVNISITAKAEIYQWTDEHGQTHFGDRAPNASAKDISKQVEQINLTSDLSSPEMMMRHELQKEAEREEEYNKWNENRQNQPTRAEKCRELKGLLNKVKGRVVFVDENGKDLKVSESERKIRVTELETTIRTHCQ